jgi:hypothetical protein
MDSRRKIQFISFNIFRYFEGKGAKKARLCGNKLSFFLDADSNLSDLLASKAQNALRFTPEDDGCSD